MRHGKPTREAEDNEDAKYTGILLAIGTLPDIMPGTNAYETRVALSDRIDWWDAFDRLMGRSTTTNDIARFHTWVRKHDQKHR